MSTLKYAGIGSRTTPPKVLDVMFETAYMLADKWTLRSGGAQGADTVFEEGAHAGQGSSEIFRVRDNFPREYADMMREIVRKLHPAPHRLSEFAWRAHMRNCAILLGPQLNEPVRGVLCWTPGGVKSGGTGMGITIAEEYGIPIFNFYGRKYSDAISEAVAFLETHK